MNVFNDDQAFVNKSGNLSLGSSGLDDGAGDATHKYAKNDVFLGVDPGSIISTTDPALTRIGAGSYKKTLVASTTHNVLIPMLGPEQRTFSGVANAAANQSAPHGVKVLSLALFYRVNTTDITSLTLTVYTIQLAAAASVPTATTLTGTTTGATLTQAANEYAAVLAVTTPAFTTTADLMIVGEAVIVIPASSTVDILGASWRIAMAWY